MLANQDLESLAEKLGAQIGDNSLIFPPRLGRGNGEATYVYFIGADDGPIKIGKSNYPNRRIVSIQTAHHTKLRVLALAEGGHPLERYYHKRFAAHRLSGEWFGRCPEIEAEISRLTKEYGE